MPSNDSLQTTDRARTLTREWHAAQARKAANATSVFGVAPVDGAALVERMLYLLLVMLLPPLLALLF